LPYIYKISNAIWTASWVNYNQSLLGHNEQQILLNNILLSVWETPINIKTNMKEYINAYKNKYSTLWNFKNNTLKKWDSDIEERFLKKFALNKTHFYFTAFKNSLVKQKKIAV
jgi:hypothetical protein